MAAFLRAERGDACGESDPKTWRFIAGDFGAGGDAAGEPPAPGLRRILTPNTGSMDGAAARAAPADCSRTDSTGD
jgi:hypothetical protein